MLSIALKLQEIESKIQMIETNVIPFVNGKDYNTEEEKKEIQNLLDKKAFLIEDLRVIVNQKQIEVSNQKRKNNLRKTNEK